MSSDHILQLLHSPLHRLLNTCAACSTTPAIHPLSVNYKPVFFSDVAPCQRCIYCVSMCALQLLSERERLSMCALSMCAVSMRALFHVCNVNVSAQCQCERLSMCAVSMCTMQLLSERERLSMCAMSMCALQLLSERERLSLCAVSM